ncbi:MAG TPA: response regulator [Gammaproteobacteria bacterium]|nr:response regulator [Gammaproteobacteria bacterium]
MLIPGAEPGGPWRVALVDDDTGVLRSLSRMLSMCGYEVTTFTSAADFLVSIDESPPPPEIAVVDLRMPETDGLTLQSLLADRGVRIPMVFLSGHGDVATSVRAIRAGAVDFLEKPCDEAALLASLERAADVALRDREARSRRQMLAARVETLTRREREVFHWVVTGRLNKQIAAALGTTEKTIKVHRARVMTKMHADSIADLVRMFDQLGEPALVREDDTPPRPQRAHSASHGGAQSAGPQQLRRPDTAAGNPT